MSEPNNEQNIETLPEWARNAITKANAEAAKYRTEKNDAVAQAVAAKEAELKSHYEPKLSEYLKSQTDAQVAMSAKDIELLKYQTAIKVGVPTESIATFAGLLQGSDEATLTSHAEQVVALFGGGFNKPDPAVDRSQGSGNAIPLNGDGILEALKRAVGA